MTTQLSIPTVISLPSRRLLTTILFVSTLSAGLCNLRERATTDAAIGMNATTMVVCQIEGPQMGTDLDNNEERELDEEPEQSLDDTQLVLSLQAADDVDLEMDANL
ncbi:hypothetical protein EDB83DRAFT_2538627 [Lactarius deliciosus]|nr:hypothetical protein EDB83DRAFT_2538738 [Lactarius deliciosus]KAH8976510.1 hypothetical protein EDB83DRAFT_2538627 [Lactarius deliciosus]